ncbi:MAG: FAD:protein FMN transferase [Bacillota bacterium]
MKRFSAALLLLCTACALLSSGCSGRDAAGHSTDFFAMNTAMTMEAYGDGAEAGLSVAESEINCLDALWSVGNSGSEIVRINAKGGELCDDTLAILKEALEIYSITDGAFDITVYPLMKQWGFYSGEYKVMTGGELSELLRLVGSDKLTLNGNSLTFGEPGMGIDFGGIAKGYASDRAIQIFAENGVESAIVSLGGNIQVLGTKPDGTPWRIAIRNPVDENVPIGIVSVTDKAVITSGGYERYFEKDGKTYHHILDPKTGTPAQSGLSSVTIVCGRGVLADGLSTALFVMGKEKALEFWRGKADLFDAVLVTDAGEISITAGLDGFFSSDFDFEVIR